MTGDISIKNFEVVNELLLIIFSDDSEAIVKLKNMRQKCPCAWGAKIAANAPRPIAEPRIAIQCLLLKVQSIVKWSLDG